MGNPFLAHLSWRFGTLEDFSFPAKLITNTGVCPFIALISLGELFNRRLAGLISITIEGPLCFCEIDRNDKNFSVRCRAVVI